MPSTKLETAIPRVMLGNTRVTGKEQYYTPADLAERLMAEHIDEFSLFDGIEAVHRTGVKFIPVGSVTSAGRGSVNPWFRERFKDLGTPVLSGHIRKLVHELKTFLA